MYFREKHVVTHFMHSLALTYSEFTCAQWGVKTKIAHTGILTSAYASLGQLHVWELRKNQGMA